MIHSPRLLTDLKQVLKSLEADLKTRAEDSSTDWSRRLRDEYDRAKAKERTGLAWIEWRDGEVSQAAVAWIIASVFIRFAEDNGLLTGAELEGGRVALPWMAAPEDGLERAVENETAFYAASPTMTSRDWLQQAFRTLAALPAGRTLVDPDHSPVWHAPISATAADGLLAFFRRTTPDGALVHDFSDPELDTRFLGDLYQDLSDHAKKTYALLQTPIFVEEFILDLTLTPAIAEFGLTGLRLIDPACGSGHFLLGAFERLTSKWAETAPGVDRGERVQRALDSIHGVDLNPFAIAIARFRLTVAAIKASGIATLVAAPAFRYHLAIGDSLLGSVNPNAGLDLGDDEYFEYDAEDLKQYVGILEPNQYHVVVANPPYIQPPDTALRERYRALYSNCYGKYALTVPFSELLFRLAISNTRGGGAGYVGQITGNSFIKNNFGKRLVERFFSGNYTGGAHPSYVDLTHIIDTSGAYIPGHGTPTVILIGRPRKPLSTSVRAVLGVRGEPSPPAFAANGQVWGEIVRHVEDSDYNGKFVSVTDVMRERLAQHPWSLTGGGAGDLKAKMEASAVARLSDSAESIGITSFTLADEAFIRPAAAFRRANVFATRPLVAGDDVRDWLARPKLSAFFPYDENLRPLGNSLTATDVRAMWPYRAVLSSGVLFGGVTKVQSGMHWTEYGRLTASKFRTPLAITFANVQTHNHFALDRGGSVFTSHAPIIKLPASATYDEHYDILGVLNSSAALFWLKQVSHNKGSTLSSDGARTTLAPWEDFYELTGTKLREFPLPQERNRTLARELDETAARREAATPSAIVAEGRIDLGLQANKANWLRHTRTMVALQEELDWRTYVAYGLAEPDLAPVLPEIVMINPNERAFEIRLARGAGSGGSDRAWFTRHGRAPLTNLPETWPAWYMALVERRLEAIERLPSLRLLEQPEYKRRWASATWEDMVGEAVREALLDRLEAPELWRDGVGRPLIRSAAQVADDLRRDERFRALLTTHLGSRDYELADEVSRLLASASVPALAALRYKPSGLEKFRAWERTWELQRAEDRGERVEVPVPPKYGPADFLKSSYWSARGKLDVPKERFISFPGSRLPEDSTDLYGWAGWDHAARGQAIARLANDLARAGAPDEQIIPLVGALLELEPWLKQWHDDIDARSGVSPATAVAGITSALLTRLGIGRDQVVSWRPPAPARGRRSAS